MSFLLDTNVVSELRKGSKCSRSVWEWYTSLSEDETFISMTQEYPAACCGWDELCLGRLGIGCGDGSSVTRFRSRKRTLSSTQIIRIIQIPRSLLRGVFISVLTLGELRRGIELRRLKDAPAAQVLEQWFQGLKSRHEERILPITTVICDLWGRLSLRQRLPEIDGLLAATAMHHELTLATRNTSDIQRSGVDYFNPFAG
jgi:predicted nucleic acid-binding protein